MERINRLILTLIISAFISAPVYSASVWINDARSVFGSKNTIMYEVNLRTFNSKDKNGNGIIEENLGDERGTFSSAIERLDELEASGVNMLVVMPITSVGKIKAIGTAGSLYAPVSFTEINPQLKSKNSNLSSVDEARKFVDECHKRKIRVIVDLPACASYELFLKRPELFKKDKNQNPIIPSDWTDVRLLDSGTNSEINQDVYDLYKNFVLTMMDIGFDGVRAAVPSTKTFSFWKKLVSDIRAREPQFLFLADQSSLSKSVSEYSPNTSFDKILDAGFDGYYGGFSDIESWKSANGLHSTVNKNLQIMFKTQGKAVPISDFATHDSLSPIISGGKEYSKMLIWLNATLPLNPMFTDGFSTGDSYLYPLINRKASKSYTDDEYYFVHRGQMDIFNLSRAQIGPHLDLYREYVMACRFRNAVRDLVASGSYEPLRTTSPAVFAYLRSYNDTSLVVYGNLNFKTGVSVRVFVPKLKGNIESTPVKIKSIPKLNKNKIDVTLAPGEIQVFLFTTDNSK